MKKVEVYCDFCDKEINHNCKGYLELSGSTTGTSSCCTSLRYNDICYDCTSKIFSHIFKMIKG